METSANTVLLGPSPQPSSGGPPFPWAPGEAVHRTLLTHVSALNPGALLVNWTGLHVSWLPPKVWIKDNRVAFLDTFSYAHTLILPFEALLVLERPALRTTHTKEACKG